MEISSTWIRRVVPALWDKCGCRDPVRRTRKELPYTARNNSRNDVWKRDNGDNGVMATAKITAKIPAQLFSHLQEEKRKEERPGIVQLTWQNQELNKELIRLN